MDVGTISIVLILGLIFLLAIGMPLGFASATLALLVMVMKFEPTLLTDPMSFGDPHRLQDLLLGVIVCGQSVHVSQVPAVGEMR